MGDGGRAGQAIPCPDGSKVLQKNQPNRKQNKMQYTIFLCGIRGLTNDETSCWDGPWARCLSSQRDSWSSWNRPRGNVIRRHMLGHCLQGDFLSLDWREKYIRSRTNCFLSRFTDGSWRLSYRGRST